MTHYVVTLKAPGQPEIVETVYNEETAHGMKERWEKRGEGYNAEVACVQAAAA